MPTLTVLSRLAALAMAASVLMVTPTGAQEEPSESHIQAAIEAFTAAGAARGFDTVLPAVADRTKNFLIRSRPDLHRQISDTVDGVALELVERRNDLNRQVAAIWAETFTEEELDAITAFFSSEAGKKYTEVGPQVISESLAAVQAWSDTVADEMLAASREALREQGVEF